MTKKFPTSSYKDRIWAGIIVYYPNAKKLQNLLRLLENQVDKIIIFNNGGFVIEEVLGKAGKEICEVIGTGENLGMGVAVNQICSRALGNNVPYVITFDQDSTPSLSMVSELYEFNKRVVNQNPRVAAVGPVFVDKRDGETVFPIFQPGSWWIKKVKPVIGSYDAISTNLLITSGMLLNISAWKETEGFREDYFIDHVDTEWCIRAADQDFLLFICPAIVMQHELSDESPKRIFGRLALKYSPIRRYYVFRNTTALILDKQVHRGLKLYFLTTIVYRLFLNVIIDDSKWKSLYSMLLGISDGMRGKMGRK